MDGELVVHQDTTFNASRFSVALSVTGLAMVLGVGVAWGSINTRVNRIEHDMTTLAPGSEVRQGFQQLDARLSRIEALLDSRVNMPTGKVP